MIEGRPRVVRAPALALLFCACACAAPREPEPALQAARVGLDPVPRIHLYENHSSALIAWRRAGVAGRVVLHLDGHADFDWLPDETVARVAAARPEELSALELHPYSVDGETYRRFAIWNFLYPAVRLGIVRELVWVVPDGTLPDAAAAVRLSRGALLERLQRVPLEEAATLRIAGRLLEGTLLGVRVLVCELADLPRLEEPVLLDVDLDFFSTASALTQRVLAQPWIEPEALLERLREREVRTDLVTLSYSTFGGYLPPGLRWIGPEMVAHLRREASPHAAHRQARQAEAAGDLAGAAEAYRALAKAAPDDASLLYALCRSERALAGRRAPEPESCARARALDPVLEHEALFEGDRLWLNHAWDEALGFYESYLERHPAAPFRAYALRRKAQCLWRLGRREAAEAAFREVVSLAPAHADTRLDLGELLREMGRLGEALEQLEWARALIPERAEYARALGLAYAEVGRLEEAWAQLREAAAAQPCNPANRIPCAALALELGLVEEALAQARAATSLDPAAQGLAALKAEFARRGLRLEP